MKTDIGSIVIRYSTEGGPYDCDVMISRSSQLKGHVWCLVASFVRIEDAQAAFPTAIQFAGHGASCTCVAPDDINSDSCAEFFPSGGYLEAEL